MNMTYKYNRDSIHCHLSCIASMKIVPTITTWIGTSYIFPSKLGEVKP